MLTVLAVFVFTTTTTTTRWPNLMSETAVKTQASIIFVLTRRVIGGNSRINDSKIKIEIKDELLTSTGRAANLKGHRTIQLVALPDFYQ